MLAARRTCPVQSDDVISDSFCAPHLHTYTGGVRTNLLRDWQEFADESFGIPLNWSEYMLDIIVGSILFDPDDAALTVLYTVTSPDIEVTFNRHHRVHFIVGEVGRYTILAINTPPCHSS